MVDSFRSLGSAAHPTWISPLENPFSTGDQPRSKRLPSQHRSRCRTPKEQIHPERYLLFRDVWTLLGVGDTCYRGKYADTLETIANYGGAGVFYANSSISSNIIKRIQETGGIMTAEDLAGYTALVKAPSMISYRCLSLNSLESSRLWIEGIQRSSVV